MRKITAFVCVAFLSLTLAACGSGDPTPMPGGAPEGPQGGELAPEPTVDLLTVLVADDGLREWADEGDLLLAETSWEIVCLSDDDAAAYPNLENALQDLSMSQSNSMNDQIQVLAEDARVYLEDGGDKEYFNGFTEASDYSVIRADSTAFSVIEQFGSYTGGIHPYSGVHGINLDPATGELLSLEDVLTDVSALPDLLGEQLLARYGADALFDTAFDLLSAKDERGNWEYSWNWSLGYQGLTFYFNPYELAPYAAGVLTATLWFDENPELFNPAYLVVPKGGYCVNMPANVEFPCDLNERDDARDYLVLSTPSVDEWGLKQFSVELNGVVLDDAECEGFAHEAFLVCVGDPTDCRYFLYVEPEYYNGYNAICVYDLNGAEPVKVDGEWGIGLCGLWDEDCGEYGAYRTMLMSDPASFGLETRIDLLSTLYGAKTYSVDPATGAPVSDDDVYDVSATDQKLVSVIPLEVTVLPDGAIETVEAGMEFSFLRTDGETYQEMLMSDGRECRIEVELDDYLHTINGVSEYDCFEVLWYAG